MGDNKPSDLCPPDDEQGIEALIQCSWRPTETIDLGNIFTKELTTSGSFDIRSGIWATTLGKVLQVLPIPALLVDESFAITVANQACSRISRAYEQMHGKPFADLFRDPAVSARTRSLLEEIFSTRRPHVSEALMEVGNRRIWGRVTFRCIRIMDERFVFVVVEDLTQQKKQLLKSKKQKEGLLHYQDELERRVRERTAKLTALNEKFEQEIKARGRVEEALRTLIRGIEHNIKEQNEKTVVRLKLAIKPLVEQLKTEKLTERARLLLQSMEGQVSGALLSFAYNLDGLTAKLTPQELRVCELLRSGLNTKQIAEVLGAGSHTVFAYRTLIRRKLGLTGTDVDLVAYLRKKL